MAVFTFENSSYSVNTLCCSAPREQEFAADLHLGLPFD